PTSDKPPFPDPVIALLVGPSGDGWTVGGWTGDVRNGDGEGADFAKQAAAVQTASIARYSSSGAAQPVPGAGTADVPLARGVVRLAIGGQQPCDAPCAGLAGLSLLPDVMLSSALDRAGALATRASGPSAFLYLGTHTAVINDGRQPPPA